MERQRAVPGPAPAYPSAGEVLADRREFLKMAGRILAGAALLSPAVAASATPDDPLPTPGEPPVVAPRLGGDFPALEGDVAMPDPPQVRGVVPTPAPPETPPTGGVPRPPDPPLPPGVPPMPDPPVGDPPPVGCNPDAPVPMGGEAPYPDEPIPLGGVIMPPEAPPPAPPTR